MNLSTTAVYFQDRYLVDSNSDDVKDLDIYSSEKIELDDALSDLFDLKWDEDWAWLSSFDSDKDIYPNSDTIQLIETWNGLGENAYHPWFDPDSAVFKKINKNF